MLKSLKKNQVIIYVIALMLVAAGYLNYTSEDKTIATSSDPELTYKENLADIGDATLVNSNSIYENQVDLGANTTNTINNEDTSSINTEVTSEETVEDKKEESTVMTSANVEEYFSKSKLDRDTIYSQMLETYQNIVNSTTVSEEQRSMATQEITNINNTKNSIMICENLLGTKGFEKCVIFSNGNNVSVVVKVNGELAENQVAQIQNIISREMNVEIENINITQKN